MIHYQPSTKHFSQNPAFSLMRCARHSELHFHNAVEFIYFLSGGLEISLNGVTYSPKKGDVIVINSSIVHSFVITKAPVDYYVLIASDDYFKTSGLYSESVYFTPYLRDEKVKSLFEKIIEEKTGNTEIDFHEVTKNEEEILDSIIDVNTKRKSYVVDRNNLKILESLTEKLNRLEKAYILYDKNAQTYRTSESAIIREAKRIGEIIDRILENIKE